MTTMTMTNKAAMKQTAKKGGLSLRQRFANYLDEYAIQIACGLMAMHGDCDAYRTYADLTRAK